MSDVKIIPTIKIMLPNLHYEVKLVRVNFFQSPKKGEQFMQQNRQNDNFHALIKLSTKMESV